MTAVALRSARRRLPFQPRRLATTLVLVALVAFWTVSMRPQALGGPTAVVLISGTSMEPGLRTGDLVLVREQIRYRVGDIVAYRVPNGQIGAGGVIIHRIKGGTPATGFVMRGDNRTTDDQWRPKPADVVGRHALDLPSGHRLLEPLRSPAGFAALAAPFAFVLIALSGGRRAAL